MLLILELFMTFFASHDHIIYNSDIYNYSVTDIIPSLCFVILYHTSLPKFKIIKMKMKTKNKIK